MSKGFPRGFLWGAATSSHQIEGNNDHNDWWDWEAAGRTTDRSGKACDSYKRYREDLDIAKSLNHNAHRFSIEWSRIEPRRGRYDQGAIDHYRELVSEIKERGMEPVVTLHHFTNPRWAVGLGGWENPKMAQWFVDYTRTMVHVLGRDVKHWITFNEQNVMVFKGYLEGAWPPGRCSILSGIRATRTMTKAHCAAYDAIHALYGEQGWAKPKVGIAHMILAAEPRDYASRADRAAARCRTFINNDWFVRLIHRPRRDWLPLLFGFWGRRKSLDFFGVNYYFREIIKRASRGKGLYSLVGDVCYSDRWRGEIEMNELKWEVFPRGLFRAIDHVSSVYKLPVMVTENGIPTRDEKQRERFIVRHLEEVLHAISEGAEVLGYCYWSLLDNFEWSIGYFPRFGLTSVDAKTGERKVKEGAKLYAEICRNNALP